LWQVRSYNEQGNSSSLSHLEAPTPLDRGDFSDDMTDFSSINGPLRTVKVTEEPDEPQVDLTKNCD
jgi:hypothetical protein